MNTSSGKAPHQIQFSRRSTTTTRVIALIGCCLMISAVVVVSSRGNSALRSGERLHKRNKFFNPSAVPLATSGDPCVLGLNVAQVVSLRAVPVPVPCAVVWNPATQGPIPGPDVALTFQPLSAEIVKDQTALIRLGKALFWDMQVGSDGIQACATCHFSAGADIRDRNQISPNLSDANFKLNAIGPPPSGSGLGGDALFGNSTVPFTANDPNAPVPMEPPDPNSNRPGHPTFAPNYKVVAGDFPLNDWFSPTELTPRGPGVTLFEEMSNVSRDTNDILASQGLRLEKFTGINPGKAVDSGTPVADLFNVKGTNVRRAMPRNSPTMINAGFNFDNLWEGRGSFVFNGVDSFGFRDRTKVLQENVNGQLNPVFIRITNSSLASVAVGPPLSNIAMSFTGRIFPDVGLKMTNLRPLGKQLVHPNDSVLGPLARVGQPGLNVHSYCEMIQAAFQDQWWNHTDVLVAAPSRAESAAVIDEDSHSSSASLPEFTVHKAPVAAAAATACQGSAVLGPGKYTQMQANFSLFFGLAVQAYMATLVSDNTPFDQFNGAPNPVRQADGSPCPPAGCPPIAPNPNALTTTQNLGLTVFLDDNANLGTHCADCHIPPVTTGHTVLDYQPDSQGVPSLAQGEAIEFMIMGDNLEEANYDHGMYNIGLRRSGCGTATCGAEDKGRGANAPGNPQFQNPLFLTAVPIASISRTSNLVTVTTSTAVPSFFTPGLFITIVGVTDTSFNSTFVIGTAAIGPQPIGIKLSATQFTYKVPGSTILPDATSSGGTASAGKPFPLSLVELTALREDVVTCAAATIPHVGCLPPDVARFIPDVPILPRRVTNGAFKAPNLRNIRFSGPYFHVGDSATLRQVVEFYTRGGNFPNTNLRDKTVDVDGIPPLMFPEFNPTAEQYIDALVDFLADGLTDSRVALEKGPFDHPSLKVPNGAPAANPGGDIFINVPAVGTEGRATPLPTFLNLDPHSQ